MVRYFKEAFEDIGMVHAANSTETYALSVADKSVITPLIHDTNYIDFLLAYCTEHDIGAIISLFDIDLPILARNKTVFNQKCIKVIVSDYEITNICNDKWLTYLFLKQNGFRTPKTYLSVIKLKSELKKGTVKFPLIIKPRWGMGSIGIYQADNLDELDILAQKTKNDIINSYLKFESDIDPDFCIIYQVKLNGTEYGLDIFNSLDGKFLTSITKLKLAMRAGETDSAEIVENHKLFELGKNLSQKLSHVANIDVDCICQSDKYFVLEMNCRFGGQYPFSHMAGANFPKAIKNMLLDEPVNESYLTVKYGTIGIKEILPVRIK